MGCGAVQASAAQAPQKLSKDHKEKGKRPHKHYFKSKINNLNQLPQFEHIKKKTVLNKLYQPKELIGKGTYGQVFRCIEVSTNKEFALKVVKLNCKTKQEAKRQIKSLKGQISVLRKLNHPNIIKYFSFDVSPESDSVQIVFELITQGSLKDYMRQHGPLKQAEAAFVCRQILEGLKYLHSQSIIHRDLKCANILLTDAGIPKITDFGTAKEIKVQTNEDIAKLCASLKGTPYYMAPEILKRSGHHQSADIWSFGCTLIELLTGKAPWVTLTNNFQEIISYIVSGIHPPIPAKVSPQCEYFLQSCFNVNPSQRLTAQELLQHKFIINGVEEYNKSGLAQQSNLSRQFIDENDEFSSSYELSSSFKSNNQRKQAELRKGSSHLKLKQARDVQMYGINPAEVRGSRHLNEKKGNKKVQNLAVNEQDYVLVEHLNAANDHNALKNKQLLSESCHFQQKVNLESKNSRLDVQVEPVRYSKPIQTKKSNFKVSKTADHVKMTQQNLTDWHQIQTAITNSQQNQGRLAQSHSSHPLKKQANPSEKGSQNISIRSNNNTQFSQHEEGLINTTLAQEQRQRLKRMEIMRRLKQEQDKQKWENELERQRQILRNQSSYRKYKY